MLSCDDTCTLKVCGRCWNEGTSLQKHHCNLWLFLFDSFEQQFVSFQASICIVHLYTCEQICDVHQYFILSYSHFYHPVPFTYSYIYGVLYIHIALQKMNFILEYLARLICFFWDSHFAGDVVVIIYLFILSSCLFSSFSALAMSVCICMREVYICASGKHHHLIWFSIKNVHVLATLLLNTINVVTYIRSMRTYTKTIQHCLRIFFVVIAVVSFRDTGALSSFEISNVAFLCRFGRSFGRTSKEDCEWQKINNSKISNCFRSLGWYIAMSVRINNQSKEFFQANV